jgi:hypothetical protein
MYKAFFPWRVMSAVAVKNAMGLLAWFTLRAQRWRLYVPPKRRCTSVALHGIIPGEIVTAVRTWNPMFC